jgi:predicted alpha/beta superfamily hydrolase
VDETAQDLIKKQEIPSIIIVGIWNTADRVDEYTLTKDDRLGRGGRGLDYIRFMTEELKPFIDATYRTQAERGSTIIGGSSLGGLIAIHACLQKPEVFGCCLAFSPTLGWDQERLLQSFQNGGKWPADVRLWFGMGTREGRDPELQKSSITRAQRLHQLLDQPHTNTPMQIRFQEFADATHNEKSWAIQFPVALKSMMAR